MYIYRTGIFYCNVIQQTDYTSLSATRIHCHRWYMLMCRNVDLKPNQIQNCSINCINTAVGSPYLLFAYSYDYSSKGQIHSHERHCPLIPHDKRLSHFILAPFLSKPRLSDLVKCNSNLSFLCLRQNSLKPGAVWKAVGHKNRPWELCPCSQSVRHPRVLRPEQLVFCLRISNNFSSPVR